MMVREPTDAEVFRRSITQPEIFALIFDRHVGRVHGFLERRVGRDAADPLTGETFRIAFERRAAYQFDQPASLPWLYGIAGNLLRQHWRGQAREERSLARLWSQTELADGRENSVIDRASAHASWPVVKAALLAMRAEERDVILLVAWEELTYDEVALAVGVPIGTVRSRLHRARRHLREQISSIRQEEDSEPTTRDGRCMG
jgi:RNA polymerase sigma factor (sigma-70 family)